MDKKEPVKDLEKGSRIREAVKHLKRREVIEYQKELSNLIDYDEHGISRAVNGYVENMDGVIREIVKSFPEFNYDYLMFGDGDLLVKKSGNYNYSTESGINAVNENSFAYNNKHDIIEILKIELDGYKKREERYMNDIDRLNNENGELKNEIKGLNLQIKELNKKSRKQSGGSVSEQIADAG